MCKIPEIRDQEYDIGKNKVKISVISCCPDMIRDKLSRKGGTSILKIEIIVEKPKHPNSDHKPKPAPADTKAANKPRTAAVDHKGDGDSKKPQVAKKMMFEPPVHGYPQIMYPPTNPVVGYRYGYESYDGNYGGGAPFKGHGYGMPLQPCGYGSYDYGYNQNNNMTSDNYENPQGCSIM
ncbi:uncharacterized protein LOC112501829 isoform X2 [Cynara cardunculus var. scolymus]|nr:uncharacterized protein LOC112501829 isoform X2 [Cynara cardunculus var. scolymus]